MATHGVTYGSPPRPARSACASQGHRLCRRPRPEGEPSAVEARTSSFSSLVRGTSFQLKAGICILFHPWRVLEMPGEGSERRSSGFRKPQGWVQPTWHPVRNGKMQRGGVLVLHLTDVAKYSEDLACRHKACTH